jgi:hypothetical protein
MALAIRAIVDGAFFHFTGQTGLDIAHYIDETVRLFGKATAPNGESRVPRHAVPSTGLHLLRRLVGAHLILSNGAVAASSCSRSSAQGR